jgi:predicted hydrocarbon binding protein
MPRESLAGGRVKGGILRSRLDCLERQPIPGGLDGIRARVSPETATLLDRPLLPISWYPFRALVEIDRAIAAAVGGDERAAIVDLGRQSARLNLSTIYRAYRKEPPHAFFEAATRIRGQYMDFGHEGYERTGTTSCRISLADCQWYAKAFCWSALGYYQEATRLNSGRDPVVQETECLCEGGKGCRFDIRWS